MPVTRLDLMCHEAVETTKPAAILWRLSNECSAMAQLLPVTPCGTERGELTSGDWSRMAGELEVLGDEIGRRTGEKRPPFRAS